ncbi:helix-turn-helix transcriptional regulator [Brevundimonas sp. NIBR11]|uniref:helix-turn-helix domain-containing protein n=1 Tax=Brevundimonas sp. NIBR11 TaxID=3015999 RepID=UPI0022F0D57C|nr:helix-turn-helix transcriptional regulator [Brevundimonas sp. NIBR11]
MTKDSVEAEEARDRPKTRHIDVLLGQRVRLVRDAKPVSREDMADYLGVSVATIQRYENGSQRIAAARLWQICRRLDVKLAHLFAGLPHQVMTDGGVAEERRSTFDREDGRAKTLVLLAKAVGKLPADRLEIAVPVVKALKPNRKR